MDFGRPNPRGVSGGGGFARRVVAGLQKGGGPKDRDWVRRLHGVERLPFTQYGGGFALLGCFGD